MTDTPAKTLKMRELEARTGVGREAIRFYIREGLLPEPERPKRNVANYSEDHVIRVKAIKRLQEERFLPLSVIKAILNADEAAPAASAEAFPHLDTLLSTRLAAPEDALPPERWPALADLAAEVGESEAHVHDMVRVGFVEIVRDDAGAERLSPRDAAIMRLWCGLKKEGFTEELGFTPDASRFYVEFVDWLASQEIRLFYEHMADKVAEPEAVRAAERGIEIVNQVLGLMRTRALLKGLRNLNQSQ
ncbi:MAG: MerR family transcriptional regulator [Sphingomonadales bacterium]|nr:MerR family transcriptional regulator [Sphingomonadales bacterium]